MTRGSGEIESRWYDGILLVALLTFAMALVLITGCGRKSDFADATALQQVATSQNAGNGIPEAQREKPVKKHVIKTGVRNHDRINIYFSGRLAEVFNDSNKYQYAAAEKLGMRPMKTIGDAYFTSRPIVMVTSNEFYTIDSLTHSFPFLVPEAERCLRDIGAGFIDSLASRGADSYRILVTSLLRSPHTVKRLRRVNRNAVDSSTHQFGTTFDISFTRFHNTDPSRTINEEDLKNLLAEVLLDMKNNGRCLVKYERKGGCFHITATH